MARLDGVFRSAARKLISDFGATATLTRRTKTIDPGSNEKVSSETTATVKVSPPEPYKSYQINGTLVKAGDAHCLIASTTLEAAGISLPASTLQDVFLTLGSDVWMVVALNQLRSGDQSAAVELQLRR